MYPALGLFAFAPAAGARVFVGRRRRRARRAADRAETLSFERMARQAMRGKITSDLVRGPVRERIELDAAVLARDEGEAAPPRALEALAAVDPGGEARERAR